jgi:RNA recognition motif-containing protein
MLCHLSCLASVGRVLSGFPTLPLPEFKHRVFFGQVGSIMKLYVGNLSFNTSESQLREIFEAFGDVSSASLVMDRETGRPRGFGFVEFSNDESARAAIAGMNGKNVDGRDLTVNEAKPREAGGGRGGFGGGGGGGRGGFGGGGGGGGGRRGGGW